MSRAFQLVPADGQKASPLRPELKDFIDRVIVPILVNEYFATMEAETDLAKEASDATHYAQR